MAAVLALFLLICLSPVAIGELLDLKAADEFPYWSFMIQHPDGRISQLSLRGKTAESVTADVLQSYCKEQLGISYCIVKGPWRENDDDNSPTPTVSHNRGRNPQSGRGSSGRP